MTHFVLGPGAIGGLIGGVLAYSGESVVVVPRTERYPPELSVQSQFGTFTAPVGVASRVEDGCDVLWVTVKATQLKAALERVSSATRIGTVVPLLNGIDHLEVLRTRFGQARVIAATIAVESERVRPGVILHKSPFARLGVSFAGQAQLQPAIDHLVRFGFDCCFVDNEATLMWSKLVFLVPFAVATTAAASPIGVVLRNPERKMQLEEMVREACAVASHCGAEVEPQALIKSLLNLPPEMRSSMQRDVEAGNASELDAIVGPVLRGAEAHRLPLPIIRQAVEDIQRRLK